MRCSAHTCCCPVLPVSLRALGYSLFACKRSRLFQPMKLFTWLCVNSFYGTSLGRRPGCFLYLQMATVMLLCRGRAQCEARR